MTIVPQTGPVNAPQADADGVTVNPLTMEYGLTGLKRGGGTVNEEMLTALQGVRGQRVYAEMANDPMIGGVLLAMNEIIGRLDWHMEAPENPTPEEQFLADFVEECLVDMSSSWDVILGDILSMLTFGWSYLETVYKVREGASDDPTRRSKFSDGRVGWRKFALRSQETLTKWALDEVGGILGMIQQDPNAGVNGLRAIPIQRALLFRTSEFKGNPEGRSMLRSAYQPWYYAKRIMEIEAIGIERDLAGMPMAYGPPEWFETPNDPRLNAIKDLVTKSRRNEVDGGLLPSVYDENNNLLVKFELLSTGGNRQFDTNAIVGRYKNDIATSMLMDFLTLGHEDTGSYALGTAKISMWQLVIESIAKGIAEVVNQHAIPRLMRLNGWMPERMPELSFGDVAQADLTVLGTFLQQMIAAGAIVPDSEMEAYLRDIANLPPSSAMEADTPLLTPAAPLSSNPLGLTIDDSPHEVVGDPEGNYPDEVTPHVSQGQ